MFETSDIRRFIQCYRFSNIVDSVLEHLFIAGFPRYIDARQRLSKCLGDDQGIAEL